MRTHALLVRTLRLLLVCAAYSTITLSLLVRSHHPHRILLSVGFTSSGTSSMRLPDIDIFEGSRRVVPPEPIESGGTEDDEMGANSSVIIAGGKGNKAVDQLSLVANRLPSKPTEAVQANLVRKTFSHLKPRSHPFYRCIVVFDFDQRIILLTLLTFFRLFIEQAKLHGGKHIAGQKDREIPIGMISPSARTHLPAPGYGYTTGHGLIGANERSVSGGGQLNSASFTSNSPTHAISPTSKISIGGNKKNDSDGGVIIKERPDIARQILR